MVAWSTLLSVFSFFVWQSESLAGIDLATTTSSGTFSCLKSAGNSIAIVRGYKSIGQVDSAARTNIANAWAGGMSYVDVYAFPCRSMEPEKQVNDLINALDGMKYGMIWLDLEYNPKSSCNWASYSDSDNCEYAKDLVAAVKARGKTPGIYSSYGQWEMMFGSASSCKSFTNVPLWYAHYDNVASFSDWTRLPFGGWTNPVMKQYVGDTTACSTGIDKNIEFGFYTSSAYPGNAQTTCNNPVSDGGVRVTFPSGAVLTSVKTCDTKYADPNNAGTYVFSISSSGASTKLSSNFQLSEFQSPDDADGVRVSPTLVSCLQSVRTNLQQSLYIKSAYMTKTYAASKNAGAAQSYHMSGTASDVYINGDVLKVAKSVICLCRDLFVSKGGDIGLALGDTFVHVDMRDDFSSWVETGSQYTSSQWLSYISSTYNSCSGKYSGIKSSEQVETNSHEIVTASSSGCVQFPSACLTPVSYSDAKYNDPNKSGTKLFSASKSGKSTKLSTNFAVGEFTCKDGSDGFRLAPELVKCLQTVRDYLKKAVYINSAYRTTTHNANEGGATYSRHTSGTAADSRSDAGLMPYANAVICKCRQLFKSAGQDIGLGLDSSYIHVDMRPYYSYWIYSGASMDAESWNKYIQQQWSKCSGSSSSRADQDYNEDASHNDVDEYENDDEVAADVEESSDSSSSSSNNNDNTAVIVSVIVVVAVFSLALGYLLYRRHSRQIQKHTKNHNESAVPLNTYVHLDDKE